MVNGNVKKIRVKVNLSEKGEAGKSAYELAVANGYEGTEAEWIASITGVQGPEGPAGADGASAYEVAVAGGFVGTEVDWLATLVGPAGADGAPGPQGIQGPAGLNGDPGPAGVDGASAYEVAVAGGFVGTEAEWLATLVGPIGPEGPLPTLDSINMFQDVDTVSVLPEHGQTLSWNAVLQKWVPGTIIYVQDTEPIDAPENSIWINTSISEV